MVSPNGGQKVITNFAKYGQKLYTPAPLGMDPLERTPVWRTAVNLMTVNNKTNHIIFFKNEKSVEIALDDKTQDSSIATWTDKTLFDSWPGLFRAGMRTVHATCPVPYNHNVWFFNKERTILMDITNNNIVVGAVRWAEYWSCLAKTPFTRIDAAVPFKWNTRGGIWNAWLFSGQKCIQIEMTKGVVITPVTDITTAWTSLAESGFTSVDMAILKPNTKGSEFYFFSGSRFCLVRSENGGAHQEVLVGATEVQDVWKALKLCDFY